MKHAPLLKTAPTALVLLLLTACGNPEKSAQSTIDHVQAAMVVQKSDLDPQKQLDAYDGMVKQVTSVGNDYAKTSAGRAIAAGQSVNGVSLSGVIALRDAMAARAKCYADPSVACLTPFSSHPNGDAGGTAAGSVSAVAEQQVCGAGFAAADKSLDAIKINQQAYAQELVQVALAAAKCHRPDDVRAAIAQYIKVDPAQGGANAGALLSVLATAALRPAWPMVIQSLEAALQSGHMAATETASVMLSLALEYAQAGDAKAALAKYATFTDTLHYQADADSRNKLVAALILDGEADTALKIAGATGNQDITAVMLHYAAVALGKRMGLMNTSYSLAAESNNVADIQDDFTAVAGPEKARDEASAAAFEAQLDQLAPVATRSQQTVGMIGFETDYGILALAYQKLGNPAKANAAINKAFAHRTRLLGSDDASGHYDYASFAKYPALLAIAQNRLTDAAGYINSGNLTGAYGPLLLRQAGRTLDATQTLSLANSIAREEDMWHCYSDLIPAMAKAGKSAEVQKLIDAWTGNPAQKADFHGWIVDGMVVAGDADGARKYAESHHMADTPKAKLRLDFQLLSSKKVASDKSQAEPLIREMFAIGQDMDKAGGISHGGGYYMNRYTDQYIAQNAAKAAFENGYVDLGIELYQKAANKDQRPLLAAFDGKISKPDITRVLMLAQNNVDGQKLAYVIDHVIGHLESDQG